MPKVVDSPTIEFLPYCMIIVSRAWQDIRHNIKGTLMSVAAAIAATVFRVHWKLLQPDQQWLTVISNSLFTVLILVCFCLFYLVRAPWKLYNERERVIQEMIAAQDEIRDHHAESLRLARAEQADAVKLRDDELAALRRQVLEADSKIGCPEISLLYSEPDLRGPVFEGNTMITFDRESELIVRNGSDRDAYEVRLKPTQIGAFTVQGRVPTNVPSNKEQRLDYIVYYEDRGICRGNLEYRHNLRPLLDATFRDLNSEEGGSHAHDKSST
jgi:hypothetical protein